MEIDQLRQLLELVSQGELSVEVAEQQLAALQRGADVKGVTLDLDRQRRCGFPEVIYGENKTAETIISTMQAQRDFGQPSLATRVSADKAKIVTAALEDVVYNQVARVLRWNLEGAVKVSGRVVVISAGTSDLPVAAEAVETLIWMGITHDLIEDVGVAGPHRLVEHLENLDSADVLIVVVGLEGALPSVVGGYVDCPVLAVPTSVGYSTAFGGITALLGMLNSCASNVLVTNVDAGFKAAYNAGVMLRRLKGGET